jgi:hypothetical protein
MSVYRYPHSDPSTTFPISYGSSLTTARAPQQNNGIFLVIVEQRGLTDRSILPIICLCALGLMFKTDPLHLLGRTYHQDLRSSTRSFQKHIFYTRYFKHPEKAAYRIRHQHFILPAEHARLSNKTSVRVCKTKPEKPRSFRLRFVISGFPHNEHSVDFPKTCVCPNIDTGLLRQGHWQDIWWQC